MIVIDAPFYPVNIPTFFRLKRFVETRVAVWVIHGADLSAATPHTLSLPLSAMCKTYAKHKVENAILYFAARIQRLSVSKATTLLYLADEYAVRKTGVPILLLSFRADVNGPSMVGDFPKQLLKTPVKPFVDDEFSDCEINILQDIVNRYRQYTDKELVEVLINENTLGIAREGLPSTDRFHATLGIQPSI